MGNSESASKRMSSATGENFGQEDDCLDEIYAFVKLVKQTSEGNEILEDYLVRALKRQPELKEVIPSSTNNTKTSKREIFSTRAGPFSWGKRCPDKMPSASAATMLSNPMD